MSTEIDRIFAAFAEAIRPRDGAVVVTLKPTFSRDTAAIGRLADALGVKLGATMPEMVRAIMAVAGTIKANSMSGRETRLRMWRDASGLRAEVLQ